MAESKIEKYGLMWDRYLDPVHMEMYCIQHGGQWTGKDGTIKGMGLFYHYKALQTLLWPEDDHHRWSDLMLDEILKNRITAIMGPKDCVSGDTRLVDPITGEQPSIQYLAENGIAPTVMTLEGPVRAGVPFYKGAAPLFQIECDDGKKFTGTGGHLVLTDAGFLPLKSLVRGQSLLSYEQVPAWPNSRNRVNKIKRIGVGKYYDLTVPVAHHYFAEGCIHHNSSKTHCALSKFSLTDYYCFPNETLVLISSTDLRGLELRVWGDLKTLYQRAKEAHPWLPGHLIDSKHAISTQNIKEGEVRDMRKGIVCIPCMSSGGAWIGLGKYVGIKQKRRRLLSDETQFMRPSFLEALANLNSGDFKGVFVGNPIGENDPLDKISEPKEGWGSEGQVSETRVWDNRFSEGRTINLIGTDSPNFDYPDDDGPRFPYLINRKSISDVVSFYGKDSLQYYSQCLGVRRVGLDSRRVITKALCRKFRAFDPVIWRDNYRTRVYAVDAAYGGTGGDRCVSGMAEFGRDINNRIMLLVHEPTIIPVSVAVDKLPEDQIAEYVKSDCERLDVPASQVFYDATGRGSLGTSFARIWSAYVNPVEFGGRATERPVSANLTLYDESEKRHRFKRCDEQYSKFVTELWWSARLIIESDQMRGLPEHVADEGCAREWKMVKGDKIEIESKADMKERIGYSPDKFDWLVTCIEGARRLGFVINKLASQETVEVDTRWKTQMKDRARQLRKQYALNYAA